MRLTRQTEIAISILISCARGGRLIDTQFAAVEAHTTKDHAAQVLKTMVRAGWIETRRGRGGGLSLAVDADHLLLGDIVRTMQPASFQPAPCTSETMDRSLVSVLVDASTAVHDFLDCYSIADLVENCPGNTSIAKKKHVASSMVAMSRVAEGAGI